MSLHDGDFGNACGRREAFENRDAIERRARIEAASASAVRDRLEKGSPSSARRNFAGMLNELVRDAAGRELPGLAALAEIRKGQNVAPNAGDARASRFDFDEKYDPPQGARAVRDAGGGVRGEGGRYFANGEPEAIEAEFLLDAARALIEAVR